ncbi:GNAT family N-acetyltransferase [Sungkyunkwania multivorans]|uniref:GNAT family N-acetyltransferase n=1 Tax=Sungkyunkwania multivorans TaxID=1173618 RepID=A0ABW3CUX6_9FLAO
MFVVQKNNTNFDEMHQLVQESFLLHVAPQYSKEGIDTFLALIQEDNLKERAEENTSLFITARHHNVIIGVLELRQHSHITLLFVKDDYRGKGVAFSLLESAIKRCKNVYPDMKRLTLNASPNSLHIYKRMGFVETADQQQNNGVIYTPMKYVFSD